MNLAVITTLGANAGDNFIYEGFRNIFPPEWIESTFLIDKTQIPRRKDYRKWIDAADLTVICGSPILYENCYRMHWQRQLLDYCEKRDKPMLLFAVGSNFPCSSEGIVRLPEAKHHREYAAFMERYRVRLWKPLSVRDRYAQAFLASLGVHDSRRLTCPSLFARPLRNEEDGEWIAFIWGETYWQAPWDADRVFERCRQVQRELEVAFREKRIVWFCHDAESYRQLRKRLSSEPIVYSNNPGDYLAQYVRCALGVSVKVHGSMVLASMGIPSVLFQLDSRAATLEAIEEDGVPLATAPEEIAELCRAKWERRREFREKIDRLKRTAQHEYTRYFSDSSARR